MSGMVKSGYQIISGGRSMKSVLKYETKITVSHKPPVLLLLGLAAAALFLLLGVTSEAAGEE